MKRFEEVEEKKEPSNPLLEPTIDPNCLDVVLERVEAGLIGSLKIIDEINLPLFKKGDIVHLRAPSRLLVGDFVLYISHEDYFIRRIIRYHEDDIFVAGDAEKECHIIHKDDVIGKVLARDRNNKRLSFTLKKGKKLYTFRKVKFAKLRLGDRVLTYDDEVNSESLELALQATLAEQEKDKVVFENSQKSYAGLDLDSELASFIDPDSLVDALLQEANGGSQEGESEDEETVVYVDEAGNEVDYDSNAQLLADDDDSESDEASQ